MINTKFLSSIYGARPGRIIKVERYRPWDFVRCQSPILKFLPDDVVDAILQKTGAVTGGSGFFGLTKHQLWMNLLVQFTCQNWTMDLAWVELAGVHYGLVGIPDVWMDEKTQRWYALHHPVTCATWTEILILSNEVRATVCLVLMTWFKWTELAVAPFVSI